MTHRTAPALLVAALLTLAGGWAGPAARGAGEPTPSSTPGVAVAAAGLPPVATLPVEQFNVVVEKTNAYTAALNVAQEVHRAHDVYTATVKPEPIPPEIIAKVKAATVLVPKSPMLPTADAAVGELEASLEILVPNLQREVELNGGKRSKGDGGKTGREVSSAQTITSFERFFAAETALRAAVAEVRPLVERRQLAVGEQARGRDLGWHVRGVLGAVKPLVELIPATPPPPNRPPMDPRLYAARLADLDAAWTALDTYANAHPPEVAALPDGVALRGDLGALVAAARQLRPALEAKKLDQAAIGKRINELINRYNAAVKRVNAAAPAGG